MQSSCLLRPSLDSSTLEQIASIIQVWWIGFMFCAHMERSSDGSHEKIS